MLSLLNNANPKRALFLLSNRFDHLPSCIRLLFSLTVRTTVPCMNRDVDISTFICFVFVPFLLFVIFLITLVNQIKQG